MENLPEYTVIKYSWTQWLWLIVSPLILLSSVHLLTIANSAAAWSMAIIACLAGTLLTCMHFKDIGELTKARLILSRTGMKHRNGQVFSWAQLSNEQIVYLGRHHRVAHLSIETPAGKRLFKLQGWDRKPEVILQLVKSYRILAKTGISP